MSALPRPPEFPLDRLPEPIRSYVACGAKALGAPAGMIATPQLAFAGATIGNVQSIELKPGYVQRPSLNAADVGPPGSIKTPSIDTARHPLDVLQREACERFEAEMSRYEQELAAWEALAKEERRLEPKPVKPVMEHLFTTNTTTEALVPMLANNRGVAVCHDEMTSWVHQMDAYRGGKGGDRQAYLSLWSGSPIKIDRKGQDSLFVPRPVAAIVGGIQPELLPDLADEGGRRDGFIERLLWEYPEPQPARWTDETIDEAISDAVVALFRRLRASTADRPVRFDGAARVLWRSWYDDNAALVQAASGVTAGIYAKLPNQLARLALILHCLQHPDEPPAYPLGEATLADAIELVEYYRAMANRVVVHFGARPAGEGGAGLVGRIAAYLRRLDGAWATLTAINRHLNGHARTSDIADAITDLEERGDIETRRVAPATGRPATEVRWKTPPAEEAEKAEEVPRSPGSGPFGRCGRSRGRSPDGAEGVEFVDEVLERDTV